MSRTYKTVFELGGQLDSTFKKSFNQADKSTGEVGKALNQLNSEAKETQGVFGKLSKAVGSFGGIVSKVAQYTGAYALVTGVADTLGNLTGSIFSAQDAMNQMAAATGASKQEMQGLTKSARNLYAQNIGEDWTDIAEALSLAKQVTKQEGAALESTTRNAIIFRDVFGEDIKESIKASDTMMINFGISSDESFNLLAQGAQKGLDKSGELLDSANEYAPYFNALGFTANQMFDTFAAGLEKGAFNLDKVGDAVKEFNIRVKDDSKGTNEAFTSLGLNASNMAQTFAKGGPDAQKAFKQVVAAISNVQDPVKKNTIGVQLFGTMFEDLEKDVIKAMGSAQSQFDMTKNTMEQIREVKYDSVSMAFRGIGRQLITSFILPIGDWLLPYLNQLGNWFNSAIPKVKTFFGQVGSAIGQAVDMLKDNIGPIFTSMFGSIDFNGIISNVIKVKDELIAGWSSILPQFKKIFVSVGKIFGQYASVVGKVVSTVVQVALKMYQAFLPIASYLAGKLYPVFSKVFGFIANDIAPAISRAFSSMLPVFISVADKIGQTMSAVFNFVKPIIDGLVAAFNFAFPVIRVVVVGAIDAVSGVFNGLMTTLGGVLDFITGVFTGNWSQAWQGVKDIFGGIFDSLASLIKAPINAVIGLINQAISSINTVSVDIPDWVPEWAGGGKTLGFSVPEIPMLAKGGIATGPTLAMVGEGKEDEAILPLSKLEGLLGTSYNSSSSSNANYYEHTTNIYLSGAATQQDAERVAKASNDDFENRMRAWKKQQQRVSFA